MTDLDVRHLVRWLSDQEEPVHLAVACAEHSAISGWQQVPAGELPDGVIYVFDRCLSAVPVAVLLELAAAVQDVTTLLDGCGDEDGATNVVAEAHRLLAAVGLGDRLGTVAAPPSPTRRLPRTRRRRPVLTAATVPVARRRLFGVAAHDRLEEPSSNPRRRTVDALRRLGPDVAATEALRAVPSGSPRLQAEGCVGEGVCVRVCPEQALALTTTVLVDRDETPRSLVAPAVRASALEQFVLSVDPAVCTGCGACLDVCPEGALRRDGEYGWGDLLAADRVTLRVGALHRCTRCRAPHAGSGPLCELCAFRRDNPFGSRMPPRPASDSRRSVEDRQA